MRLVFLLEEKSMRETLKYVIPRLIPEDYNLQCTYVTHEGKSDLMKSIPKKLMAWREPNVHFIVLCDQDQGSCEVLKAKLQELCQRGHRPGALIRIACRELESWFLGDLRAVGNAFGNDKLASLQRKQKFREPDRIGSPAQELRRLIPGYQKVTGARKIAPHLALDEPGSRSFFVFLSGVRSLVQDLQDIP